MRNGNQHLHDWLVLHLTSGLGAGSCKKLVDHFGGPRRVLEAGLNDLLKIPGIRRQTLTSLTGTRKSSVHEQAALELKKAQQYGIRIITWDDQDYPQMLRNIHNPPMILYVKGVIDSLHSAVLGVVGSRAATSYGKSVSGRMAFNLAEQGFTIISGMALGVDTEAHKGAIAAGGKTVAVLGCGLDVIYPRDNLELYNKIPTVGAIVTEYPFGTKPDSFRFPARNRIISGLALGVLVVEASLRSGSLITARHALEQGREVFAVPGRVDSVKSAGTHSLLQQGAKLVQSVRDITEELPVVSPLINKAGLKTDAWGNNDSFPGEMMPEEEMIFSFLEIYPKNIDEIVRGTKLSPQKVNESLLLLELKGIIEAMPGKCFKRM